MKLSSPQRRLIQESDVEIRRLERLAAAGDPEARVKLQRARQRIDPAQAEWDHTQNWLKLLFFLEKEDEKAFWHAIANFVVYHARATKGSFGKYIWEEDPAVRMGVRYLREYSDEFPEIIIDELEDLYYHYVVWETNRNRPRRNSEFVRLLTEMVRAKDSAIDFEVIKKFQYFLDPQTAADLVRAEKPQVPASFS